MMLKKKNFTSALLVFLAMIFFTVSGVSAKTDHATENIGDVGVKNQQPANPAPPLVNNTPAGTVIYDNGPFINSPGTGVGGADESILQTSLNMTTFGFGHQVSYSNIIADDFVVAGSGMDIGSITFFAYQTNSATTSTITAYNVSIYNAKPGTSGASVVATSSTINTTVWSNVYRVTESGSGSNTQRPIMATEVDMGAIHLLPGTYWITWQVAGDANLSGPWAPPLTITGQAATGNAMQSIDGGNTWADLTDNGSGDPQGFPFVIRGIATIPTLSEYGMIMLLLLLSCITLIILRRRQIEY